MIIWDTETTGLVGPEALPLAKQPRIIEFCAVKLDKKTLKEIGCINFLIHPTVALPPEITRITGITDKDLAKAEPFPAHIEKITEFFLGVKYSVAHNLDFDSSMLKFELQRIGREFSFPWPPRRICTVEKSYHLKNRRMKLTELHEIATGRPIVGVHRAINDVKALADVVRWLKEKGKL